MAMQRRKRTVKNARLSSELVWRIKEYITNDQWSPRQISGYLRKSEGIKVSHQSIYNIIHNDTTGGLAKHTRHKMKYRHRPKGRHLPIKDRLSIHERSKEVDGKRFGDFEMDLILDPDQHAILTLVEKSTNMLLMQKLPFGKQSKPLAKVVRKLLLPYKDILKTITTDNGPEFAAHKDITKFLGVPVYFADPYCSWQKGAIENTNKLIRQYIPKKDSFEHYTEKRIMSIQKKLNERPREKLNFSTPKCEFLNSAVFFLVRKFYMLRCLFGTLYVDMRCFGVSWFFSKHKIPHPNQWGILKPQRNTVYSRKTSE